MSSFSLPILLLFYSQNEPFYNTIPVIRFTNYTKDPPCLFQLLNLRRSLVHGKFFVTFITSQKNNLIKLNILNNSVRILHCKF